MLQIYVFYVNPPRFFGNYSAEGHVFARFERKNGATTAAFPKKSRYFAAS